MNREKGRFTLIELLVVVSIIAILAGLLLPALNKVRQKGYMIICLSNERSLGTANGMYFQDNKDYFMNGSSNGWAYQVVPYLGMKTTLPVRKRTVFACSADTVRRNGNAAPLSYSLLAGGTNWANGWTYYDSGYQSRRVNRIKETSKIGLATEFWNYQLRLFNVECASSMMMANLGL